MISCETGFSPRRPFSYCRTHYSGNRDPQSPLHEGGLRPRSLSLMLQAASVLRKA